jgi:lipid II:glycine glycyltransferase (peptidoglycan interpeptide bridge formation enzyme)
MDLSHDLDTIRKEIHHKWRAHLNKAEKQGLVIEEREDPAAFDIFLQLSTQMMDRKNFVPGVDYKDFKYLFERLPSHLNMHLVTCKKDNEIISVIIYTKIGSRAIYILGATGNAGLKANGSNLIHWNIIQRLKDDQCITYDLGGINPETNYGGYEFKNRLSWKNGTTVQHIGEYECYASQFTKITLSIADKIRILLKKRR